MPGGQFSVRVPHSWVIGLLGIGEVGNPDIVVAVHRRRPRAGQTAAGERRAGILGTVRSQQRDAATVSDRSVWTFAP